MKLSEEKLEWLKRIGAIDISKFDYLIASNGHLYTLEYLANKSLEDIQRDYDLLYS